MPEQIPEDNGKRLSPGRRNLTEYAANDHTVTVEQGTTPKDLLNPAFWSLEAAGFKPYDLLWVRVDTGEWLVRAIVIDAGRTWTRIKILEEYKLETADVSQTQTDQIHRAIYRGAHLNWCVERVKDGVRVDEKIATKSEALRRAEQRDAAFAR